MLELVMLIVGVIIGAVGMAKYIDYKSQKMFDEAMRNGAIMSVDDETYDRLKEMMSKDID